jgi:hypothetical protein
METTTKAPIEPKKSIISAIGAVGRLTSKQMTNHKYVQVKPGIWRILEDGKLL